MKKNAESISFLCSAILLAYLGSPGAAFVAVIAALVLLP